MNRFLFTFLLIYIAGFAVLLLPCKDDLRQRANLYSGKAKDKVLGSSFAGKVRSLFLDMKQDSYEKELIEGLSYIKNLVVLGQGANLSSEGILSELARISKSLAPAYMKMERFMHLNEKQSAAAVLPTYIKSSYGAELGNFLSSWEEFNGEDLVASVNMYLQSIKEERETSLRQRDAIISDLVYIPVVCNCMIILINFIYIAYYLEQKELFEMFL